MVNIDISKSKHNAFSLPEILIVLAIVGVITVLTIIQSRPQENLLGIQYKQVLYNLDVAAYNSHEDYLNCLANGTANCHFLDGGSAALATRYLCDSLTSYINTSKNNCNPTSGNPSFTSTSGAEYQVLTTMDLDSHTRAAYIMVDINGSKRKPNSANWKRTSPPDQVYFVITSAGDAAPLGNPCYDRRYIQAKVIYPDQEKNETSVPMAYGDAQVVAYGSNTYANEVYSLKNLGTWSLPNEAKTANQGSYTQADECKSSTTTTFPACTLEIVY